ncbi:DivIVA domain-containing protein [Butyribacter sp.]|uniref:DivIVA domain-containing protein n=1 Tax=Butyribacter sp. TaxID=2822465 RepID=UPI002A96F04A|nr:DivIVA domain-containing protein [Butyribacter sp.]
MLTPADIKNRTIKTTMGGYNKKDTDEFIASILESFEELNNENKKLKEKLTSLSDGIQYYKNLEDNLQKALVLAEKTSDETKSAAKAEAANIVSLAKAEASDIVSKAKLEADELIKNTKSDIDKNVVEAQHKANILNERLSRLTSSFESYKRDIKAIVEDQLEFIESEDYSPETPVFDIPNMIGAATDENEYKNENKSDESLYNEPENSVLFKWTSVSNDGEQASVSDDTNEVSEDYNSIEKNQTTEIADENNIDDDNSDNNDTDNGNLDNNDTDNGNLDNIIDNVIEKADVMNEISAVDESDIEKVNNKTEIKETGIDEKEIKEDDSDDIMVENIMTTPTLEGVNAEISSTVFPASKPDNISVSYLSENTDSVKKDSNYDANDNPFTFIDLD